MPENPQLPKLNRKQKNLRWVSMVLCAIPGVFSLIVTITILVEAVLVEAVISKDIYYFALTAMFSLIPAAIAFSSLLLLYNNYRKFCAKSFRNTLSLTIAISCIVCMSALPLDAPYANRQTEISSFADLINNARHHGSPYHLIAMNLLVLLFISLYLVLSSRICRWAGFEPEQKSPADFQKNRRALQGIAALLTGIGCIGYCIFTFSFEPWKFIDHGGVFSDGWFIVPLVLSILFGIKCWQNIFDFNHESLRGSLQLCFFTGYIYLSPYADKIFTGPNKDALFLCIKVATFVLLYKLTFRLLRGWAGLLPKYTADKPQTVNTSLTNTDSELNQKQGTISNGKCY